MILQGPGAKEGQENAVLMDEHSSAMIREIWVIRHASFISPFPNLGPGHRGKKVMLLEWWLRLFRDACHSQEVRAPP